MKRVYRLLFVVVICSQCQMSELQIDTDLQSTNNRYNVEFSDVLSFLNAYFGLTKTQLEEDVLIEPFVWKGDTVMYYVKSDDNAYLISADKRACPIVAFSNNALQSFIDFQKTLSFHYWIENVANDIYQLKNCEYLVKNANTDFWDILQSNHIAETRSEEMDGWRLIMTKCIDTNEYHIDHILDTQWGFGSPWDECFPEDLFGNKVPIGSHTIALAQIAYWSHFKYGVLEYSYTDVLSYPQYYYDYDSHEGDETNYEEHTIITYPGFNFLDSSLTAWSQMALNSFDLGRTDYVSYLMARVRSITSLPMPEDYTMETDINALNIMGLTAGYGSYSKTTIINNLYDSIPSIVINHVNANDYLYSERACIVDSYRRMESTYAQYYIYDPNNTYNPNTSNQEHEVGADGEEMGEGDFIPPAGYQWFSQQYEISSHFFSFNWGDGQRDDWCYSADSTIWDWVFMPAISQTPIKMIYNIRPSN